VTREYGGTVWLLAVPWVLVTMAVARLVKLSTVTALAALYPA
jgi:hypothetical protein